MKIEKIKEIIKLLENSSLETLEITESSDTLKLSKGQKTANETENVKENIFVAPKVDLKDNEEFVAEKIQEKEEAKEGDPITSPMVGVFYQAPNPQEKPFVEVGDRVEKGQVVCIVEAMKLMNEIQANKSGEIVEICVGDGEPVEYGQPLFLVK